MKMTHVSQKSSKKRARERALCRNIVLLQDLKWRTGTYSIKNQLEINAKTLKTESIPHDVVVEAAAQDIKT